MELFYKATRPDGTDFYTGTVDYAAICGVDKWLPELPGGKCCTNQVYHVSTSAADTLIGGSWPCRLFEVEAEAVSGEENKRGVRTMRVVREIEAWQALGPNGQEVAALIERCKSLDPDDIKKLAAARDAAWDAAWAAALDAAWDAARAAALATAWAAARAAALDAARAAAWALVVRDLISEEHFNILYNPWASAIDSK